MSKEDDVENDTHDEDAAQDLVIIVAHEVLSKPSIREERQELGVVLELHALVLVRRWRLRPLARWCTLRPLLSICFFGKMMFWLLIMLLIHLLVPVFEELVMLLSIVLRKATALPSLKVFSFFLIPSIHILSLLPFSTLFGFSVLAEHLFDIFRRHLLRTSFVWWRHALSDLIIGLLQLLKFHLASLVVIRMMDLGQFQILFLQALFVFRHLWYLHDPQGVLNSHYVSYWSEYDASGTAKYFALHGRNDDWWQQSMV